jgi:phage regulator Rha-like protein
MDRTDLLAALMDVERLMTDTLCAARDFGKQHKTVLRTFDNAGILAAEFSAVRLRQ